ncbi:MAG: ABC transporter ATP-binding protein [Elusimicrobiota bacterium]
MSGAPKISVRAAGKSFLPGRPVLEAVGFEVRDGEFLSLLGPSGCGKTTLLRIIAGLESPGEGEVVRRPEDSRRLFAAMVFQDFALLPWRTVLGNTALGLELKGVPLAERLERARRRIRAVHLTGFEGHYPRELSSGMKQRAALARAVAADPEVLLLDEPMGALDASTRQLLQEELLSLWEAERKTILFVTHSIEEALFLSDRVLLLTARPGRVKAVLEVPFPRPRGPRTREDPRFARMAREIWTLLEDEVRRSLLEKG